MAGMFGGILQLVMTVILVTAVLIPTLKNTNSSTWTTAEVTVFGLCSLAAIFGLVNGIANMFGLGY
jgi:hypothetical protein